MFEIYLLAYSINKSFYRVSAFDMFSLLSNVHLYDSWYIEKCEIIEGLFYPIKVVARSSNVSNVSIPYFG